MGDYFFINPLSFHSVTHLSVVALVVAVASYISDFRRKTFTKIKPQRMSDY